MIIFCADNRIKGRLSYASDGTCHQPGHSKCNKICGMDTKSRPGKLLTLKPRAFSFYTTNFSYMNIFPKKIDQILGFWASQSLKLRRSTCFGRFKYFLMVNSRVAKPERLALSKMWTLNFCLSKGVHIATTSGQSAWEIWI